MSMAMQTFDFSLARERLLVDYNVAVKEAGSKDN